MNALVELASSCRVIQLGQQIDENTTKNATAPGFEQRLYSEHDPSTPELPNAFPGVTGAGDIITMSTHFGTHMDSLSHIAYQGRLFDGTMIDEPGVQDSGSGVSLKTRENFSPIVSRGVLLDFPALLGVQHLPRDYVITPAELERCSRAMGAPILRGDTVLIRTGWDMLAEDVEEYLRMPIPGPDADTARELAARGVIATGSDTMPYEAAPGAAPLEVHVELIPKAGIFIFEMMDLRELAQSQRREFLFVAAPLRLRRGTGSPINPLAILPD